MLQLQPHVEMSVSAGDRLGHYVVLSPLGAGGMGEVYRARDEQLGREIALKILPDHLRENRAALTRFAREAKAVAALSHPNIVAIHQFDTTGTTPYLVMELLEGQTLQARLARSPLPWRKAVEIGAQIADALAAAHSRAIVHRDLKPSNIFLTSANGQVKLLDFGLARDDRRREATDEMSTDIQTRSGTVLGTPSYMSPEQASGEVVDARTDIFSFGCILYEMLTGRSPFARPTASQALTAVLREDVDCRGLDAPLEVTRVIARCLEKNPEDRFQSARDVALDLRAALTEKAGRRMRRLALFFGAGAAAIALIVALIMALTVTTRRSRLTTPQVASLAVLPFENATRARESEFLSDGITENLINALSRLPNIRVLARTTAFAYKGKAHDLDALRRDLKVDVILTGRVVAEGQGLTVQADLIDLRTQAQMWGDRYQQTISDPIAIEQRIVGNVINRLRIPATSAQQTQLTARGTSSRQAYELNLRGRHEWNKRSREGVKNARTYFQQAIDSDPAFAAAYSGLADTYILMGGRFRLLPKEEAYTKGEHAARRALEIDPRMAEAHASLGQIHSNQFRWKSAEREFRQSIELNPNYATARLWYSLVLQVMGKVEDGLPELRKAASLDPLSPIISANLARCLLQIGDYPGAITEARRALELNPNFGDGFVALGRAYEYQGKYELAAEVYQRLVELRGEPNTGQAHLGRIYAKLGRTAEARAVARELEAIWPTGQIAPTQIAWIYAALGDNDRAFYWLEKALETRDVVLRESIPMVVLSELRDDPRYDELRRRILTIEK
ncbi:MAG TPA: protein kinase [Thermoanaerobaculia bacterium]|nr:protein kinase [Thermoanaerobaculia bacterium]